MRFKILRNVFLSKDKSAKKNQESCGLHCSLISYIFIRNFFNKKLNVMVSYCQKKLVVFDSK